MILIILIHSIVQVKILHYLLSFLFAFSIENKKSTKFRYKRGKILEKKKKNSRKKKKSKKCGEGHTCLGWRRKQKANNKKTKERMPIRRRGKKKKK